MKTLREQLAETERISKMRLDELKIWIDKDILATKQLAEQSALLKECERRLRIIGMRKNYDTYVTSEAIDLANKLQTHIAKSKADG